MSSNATAAHATAGEEAEARKSNHNGESNTAPSHPLPKHSQPDPEESTERSSNDTAAQATAEEEAKTGESNHDVDDDGTADDSTIDVEEVWDDDTGGTWAANAKTAAQQVSADDESVEQKGSDASNSEGLDSSFDDEYMDDIFADAEKDLADATDDIFNKGSDARADGVGGEDAKIKPNTSKTKQKRAYKKKSTNFSRNYKMPSRSASHSRTNQRYSDSGGLHEKTAPINSSSEQDINSAQEKTARAPGGLDEQSRIKTRRVVVNAEQANPL